MKTYLDFINEAVRPEEHGLNAKSHALLMKLGYHEKGNKKHETKFRRFTYQHPEHGTLVHTFINRHAGPAQKVQHHVNGQFVPDGALESRLKR